MTTPPEPTADPAAPECYRHAGRETWIRCQRCEKPICPDCMRDAAVGFQCPDCVKQGSKQTRSGRTAYGGQRSTNPALTSQILIGINAAVWLLIAATGWTNSEWIFRLALHARGLCSVGGGNYLVGADEAQCGFESGTWIAGVADGAPWLLVTSMFTHVALWHIAVNMLTLWQLGPNLELALGRARFLALYLLSGLAGSALVFAAAGEYTLTLGASGAGFGMLAALLLMAIKVRGNVREILFFIGLNFAVTVVFSQYISWQGHLGGFLGGLALMAVLIYAPRQRRTAWQVAGISAIALVVALAIVLRALALA